MQYDSSESAALTVGRINQQSQSKLGQLDGLPIPAVRVRHIDGRLASFDIRKVAGSLEQSILASGRAVDRKGQALVYDVCSRVLETVIEDMPDSGILDIDDVKVQVEMTLRLNRQADVAKAYLEAVALG